MKALLALALLASAPTAASDWTMDPARSTLGFTATWMGNAVPGNFKRWTAAIRLDPANLKTARIIVDVDTASALTGDRTVDGSLPEADWFAGSKARFASTIVTATGPGRYRANGTLTLKGKSRPVALDFALAINGKQAVARGQITLDRRWFALGLESDPTADYVAFAVPMTLVVTARRP